MTTRRSFLCSSLSVSALAPVAWLWPGIAGATTGVESSVQGTSAKVVVCIFLRGAVDGLSLVVPYTEPNYYASRRTIAIPKPGQAGGALKLDDQFGLHPRLSALKPAFDAGELAFVHAVGSPHATRSHFEAQDYLETATPGVYRNDGWLARALALTEPASRGAPEAVVLGNSTPLSLRGGASVLSVPHLGQFDLRSPRQLRRQLENGFTQMYGTHASQVGETGDQALALVRQLRTLDVAHYKPANGADYPKQTANLRDLAALIKADLGVRVGWLDIGGWDTHQGQGDADRGQLPKRLDLWARGLAAFRRDLGDRSKNVLIVVMTEFGRTLKENGTGGTDHGHGSVMLLLGRAVKGRRVYGQFPGLQPEDLWQDRDLAVTTDFRDVFAEVAEKHLGVVDPQPLFPGYELTAENRLGVIA